MVQSRNEAYKNSAKIILKFTDKRGGSRTIGDRPPPVNTPLCTWHSNWFDWPVTACLRSWLADDHMPEVSRSDHYVPATTSSYQLMSTNWLCWQHAANWRLRLSLTTSWEVVSIAVNVRLRWPS